MIFSGRGVPPLELRSDSEILNYVSSHPDAISYVSSDTDLTNDVKEVQLVQVN